MEEYIIREITSKRGKSYKHKYYDMDKKEIKDKNYIKFITEGIYIAPAYKNVKINIDKKGKVRAIGYDDKDRPQYIYNKEFIDKQKDKKFNHMVEFGKNFNKINKSINEDLYSVKETKEKQIAMILKLIMECNFRIGNERYSKKNKSYGTTTLEQQHIKIKNKGVVIDFIGKKKVRNICTVKNKKIIRTLKEKKRTLNKHDRIFSYRVGNKYYNIKSSDVNKYLKKFGKFSAKNFRTWGANMELITNLLKKSKGCEISKKKEIKEILKKSIKEVANKLHNTESVCKSNYLDPELIKYYTVDCEGFLKNFYLNDKQEYNKDDISKKYIEFLENV